MGPSGNNQAGFNFMTLGFIEKLVRQIWDALPMPDTMIARVNAVGQSQTYGLEFLDHMKRPIGELDIKGVYGG